MTLYLSRYPTLSLLSAKFRHLSIAPDKSAETNSSLANKAIGPAKILTVNAGDRVQLEVFARYATGIGSNTSLISNLASAVTTAFQVLPGEAAYTALTNNVPVQSATITRSTGVPKASITASCNLLSIGLSRLLGITYNRGTITPVPFKIPGIWGH